MPDISMCANTKCPQRKDCYRYTAKPNPYRQSYGCFEHNKESGCDFFVDNKGWEGKEEDE